MTEMLGTNRSSSLAQFGRVDVGVTIKNGPCNLFVSKRYARKAML
eukprot:jgi/Antlo1/1146/848